MIEAKGAPVMKKLVLISLAFTVLCIGSQAQTRVSIPDPGFDDLAFFEVEFQPKETKHYVINAPANIVLAVSVDTDEPENKAFISLVNGDGKDKWFNDFDDFEILTGSAKDYKISVQNKAGKPYKTHLYFSILSADKFRSISAKDYGPYTDIHQIDFQNGFLYSPVMGDIFRRLRVQNGEADDLGDPRGPSFSVLRVIFGDIDGDTKDEAIVSTSYWGGGSGVFSDDFVYKIVGGKPEVISRFGIGDRSMGGVDKVWIENGIVYVRRFDSGSHGAACCSEFKITYGFKWNGSDFDEVGNISKVPLFKVEPIVFFRGEYGTDITSQITLDEDHRAEAKRFVFRAKAGQILTLTSNDPAVTFFVYDGDSEVIEPNNLSSPVRVKLNGAGDYYFMVRKDLKFGDQASFHIDIR